VNPASSPASIAANIAAVRDRIAAACRRANRSPDSVALMAVSKGHSAAALESAFAARLTLFGENRVQEFDRKRESLAPATLAADFHLIGHLQSNKATRAAELFSSIDSLDSLRLAERLNAAAQSSGKQLSVFIELKLSDEPSKTGLIPGSPDAHALLDRAPEFTALNFRGLMTVPPWSDDAEPARPYFRRLRELRDQLAQQYPRLNLQTLSIGMSHDFEVAIEEGSDLIRVGTALFGPRRPPAP
jgi:PLP dependent protein